MLLPLDKRSKTWGEAELGVKRRKKEKSENQTQSQTLLLRARGEGEGKERKKERENRREEKSHLPRSHGHLLNGLQGHLQCSYTAQL